MVHELLGISTFSEESQRVDQAYSIKSILKFWEGVCLSITLFAVI